MWTLNRRILRNFKSNAARWIPMLLLVVICMYLVISLLGSAAIVEKNITEYNDRNCLEDGEFSTFVQLETNEIEKIENNGFILEENFYIEFNLDDDSTLRIFKNREKINLLQPDEGAIPSSNNEIFLEKKYAEKHDLSTGDSIEIGNRSFVISGIGTSPDYDAVLENLSDTAPDAQKFGTAFVTDEAYINLRETGDLSRSEEYLYSYRISDKEADSEKLKEILFSFEVDETKITDKYFNEMIDEAYADKYALEDAVKELSDASSILSDSLNDYEEGVKSFYSATKELNLGVEGLVEGISEINDGTKELDDGVGELEANIEKIDEYFKLDIDNLTMFLEKDNNARIGGSVQTSDTNKMQGIICGIVVLILLAYILSIFTIYEIDNESSVIGALYSMGVKKKSLILHYIALPVIITLIGGIIGTVSGYSKLGVNVQLSQILGYYSIPHLDMVYKPSVFIFGIVVPPIMAAIITFIVIRKRLLRTPLSLLRKERKQTSIKKINLGRFNFINCFRLRQIISELRTSFSVMFGMLLPVILVIFAFDCFVSVDTMKEQNERDTKYNYMYSLKYQPDNIPKNSTECYAETLSCTFMNNNLDVSLFGLTDDNPYFEFEIPDEKNTVVIGSGTAWKFGLDKGEQITLYSEKDNKYHTFIISDVVEYSVGLYAFMDIDDMRETFNQEDDYYNTLFSAEELDIEFGRIYSVTTKEDVMQISARIKDSLSAITYIMVAASILVYIVVTFLMIKLMIDRAALNISLIKIFGFHKKEIRKLYLDGNTITIIVSAIISVPLAKFIVDKTWFPMMAENINCGFDTTFPPVLYMIFYVSIFVLYIIVSFMLRRKLNSISMVDILKDRE